MRPGRIARNLHSWCCARGIAVRRSLRAQEIFDAIKGGDLAKVKALVDKAPRR